MITLTARRLRTITADATTEKELIRLLRYHKIRFYTDEEMEFFKVPTRKGAMIIRKIRSRFEAKSTKPEQYTPDLATCTAWADRLEVF